MYWKTLSGIASAVVVLFSMPSGAPGVAVGNNVIQHRQVPAPGQVITGTATFSSQDGISPGACGLVIHNRDFVASLGEFG